MQPAADLAAFVRVTVERRPSEKYLARVAGLPNLFAHGQTPAEAVRCCRDNAFWGFAAMLSVGETVDQILAETEHPPVTPAAA
jgi:predicted RNase H-like HicB family nuclease